MENHRLVLPEHMNQFGFLFGGYLLMWVDEMAWLAASLDNPECRFVTVAMDRVEFKISVKEGAILCFYAKKIKTGNTSISYCVKVEKSGEEIFSTEVTLVNVDEAGTKQLLPK